MIMEYQKIMNLLDNIPNQPTKFRTKNWVEINGDSRLTYNVNSQIKFKTLMLRSHLCDYRIIKICAPFTNGTSEINNTQIDNAKYIGIISPIYNLIDYNDKYSKTSENLWHYCEDQPFLNANGAVFDFPINNSNSASFKFKTKIAARIGNNGRKYVKITVPLKYLSNFWRTLEIYH